MPPSDLELQNSLLSHIKQHYSTYASKKYITFNVVGDFNSVVNDLLDHLGPNKIKKKKSSPAIRWLQDHNFSDSFRDINPTSKGYTWHKNHQDNFVIRSRIDYIWLDVQYNDRILSSKVYPSENLTNSDHDILCTKIDFFDYYMKYPHNAIRSRSKEKRKFFLYDEANEEQWNHYRSTLYEGIIQQSIHRMVDNFTDPNIIDDIWDRLLKVFHHAADSSFSS